MKKIFYSSVLLISLSNCNTPNGVIANPDSSTNTSGTTGSANMTNSNKPTNADEKNPPGMPQDSTLAKKDTVPRLPR